MRLSGPHPIIIEFAPFPGGSHRLGRRALAFGPGALDEGEHVANPLVAEDAGKGWHVALVALAATVRRLARSGEGQRGRRLRRGELA